jgi:hypothetical protein
VETYADVIYSWPGCSWWSAEGIGPEENGQVVAVRMHAGDDEDDKEDQEE